LLSFGQSKGAASVSQLLFIFRLDCHLIFGMFGKRKRERERERVCMCVYVWGAQGVAILAGYRLATARGII